MTKNDELFVRNALMDMIRSKVSIHLENRRRINDDGSLCNGYFVNEPRVEFWCAMGKTQKKWLPLFVHEYCHFCQWKDESKFWTNTTTDIYGEWDDYIVKGKKTLSRRDFRKVAIGLRKVELDCEKRAVRCIEEYDLSINKQYYIKKANAYVLFYSAILKKERWWKKRPPYEIRKILNMMPTHFMKSYSKPSKKFLKACDKYCF